MAMGFHKVSAFTPEEVDSIRDRVVYLVGTEDPFEKLGGRRVLEQNRMNAVFYEKAGHGLNPITRCGLTMNCSTAWPA